MAYTTINKSTDYFNTKLYTGNGGTQSITGVGFQPDLVWLKSRSIVESHGLFDVIRGAGERLISNSTDAEATRTSVQSSFDSDGFSVGNSSQSNQSSATYCAWNWLANGAGSANTDGSINSTVSVNTTAGFSIVSWTGNGSASTIGHGLGTVPKMIILKNRSISEGWLVYHHKNDATAPQNKYLFLNQNNAVADLDVWNDTAPTSSVFSVGGYNGSNGSGNNMIAYCFAEKTGYSKFGSYTGNGNADGSFVYTGFKPAFVMVKVSSGTTGNWQMQDTKRLGYNDKNVRILANVNEAEKTTQMWDILSNGFKMTVTSGDVNGSGNSYIYMAFGQSLIGSNNVPCTAR